MLNFEKILKQCIEKHPSKSPTARQKIYKTTKLRYSEALTELELSEQQQQETLQKLDEAICNVENEYAARKKAMILQFSPQNKRNMDEGSYSNSSLEENTPIKAEFDLLTKQSDEGNGAAVEKVNSNPTSTDRILDIFKKQRHKKNRQQAVRSYVHIVLFSILAIVIIGGCSYTGWHFFVHRNREKIWHQVINTQLDTSTSKNKFDGRLISANKNKHAAPVIVNRSNNEEIKKSSHYDNGAELKAINLSWSLIKGSAAQHRKIVVLRTSMLDSTTNLALNFQEDNKKYFINIFYNDEKFSQSEIEITKSNIVAIDEKNKAVTLSGSIISHPSDHKFIYSFKDIKDAKSDIQLLKACRKLQVNFIYKDGKKASFSLNIGTDPNNLLRQL